MTDLDNREKDIREILDDDEWYENDESRDTLADPGDDIWMGRKSERLAALLNPSPVPDSGLALLTDEECSQAVQQDVGKWAVTSKYFIMDLARVIAKAQARKQQAATSKDDMDYYNGVLHKFHLMGKAEVAAAVKDNNLEWTEWLMGKGDDSETWRMCVVPRKELEKRLSALKERMKHE